MSICNVKDCDYFSYLDTEKCSLHHNEDLGKLKIITLKDLINRYDESIKHIIISQEEEVNIFNLVKQTKEKNILKIIDLIVIYLKTINKEYINASLCLKLIKYLEGANKFHSFYWLARDYWNINSNHPSPAICYYNPEGIDNESVKFFIDDAKINKPRLPFVYSSLIK